MQNMPEFSAALAREIQNRMHEFQRGIQLYHTHPFQRVPPPARVVWERGATRLLDYAPTLAMAGGQNEKRQPLLIIPSLVNRAYILDLLPEKSFVQFLTARGFHPLLVDWNEPRDTEQDFGLSDYVTDRLLPIYDFILQNYSVPTIIGYCMGGNLALALTQLAPTPPCGLVVMATPWDFHGADMPRFDETMARQLLQMVEHSGELSVDWLQSFFTALDPFGGVEKFMRFAQRDMDGDSARLFVALEDWLSDGVPLTRGVARDTMQGWYAQNAPMKGAWKIAGHVIAPQSLRLPTLAVLPQSDRIVSSASSSALAALIPGALSLTPNLGHIGMMVSRDADTLVWEPVVGWLRGL